MPVLNGAQLLERTRRLTDDRVEPYYIEDIELYTYLTEAERALAVAGKWLRDVVTFKLKAESTQWVYLGDIPEVLEFKAAVLIDPTTNRRYDLKLLGTMDFSMTAGLKSDYGQFSMSEVPNPARPKSLIFGRRTNYLEVKPIPDQDYNIEASIVTYPLAPIESASDEPTIPERFHSFIPLGAALMAIHPAESEHSQGKVQSLEVAWQKALAKASAESGAMNRDAAPVKFNNDLWNVYWD